MNLHVHVKIYLSNPYETSPSQNIYKWVLLNRALTTSQLHHLHLAHFSLYPPPRNTPNVIRTKISHFIGPFPQI